MCAVSLVRGQNWTGLRGAQCERSGNQQGRCQLIHPTRHSMHLCLHSCASHSAVRQSFRSTCKQWTAARPGLSPVKRFRRFASPTTSVLSPSQPQIRLPGVGDLKNLNVDLSDVPDGRYREVEVRSIDIVGL